MKKEIGFVKFTITKMEFNEIMEKVDNKLKENNVPIYASPIRSFSELNKYLHGNLLISPAEKVTDENVFTNHNIGSHVDNWFESKYGERLKIHFGPGFIALLLKDDPWKMIIPLVYGGAYFICDPNLDKYRNVPSITTGPTPKRNILLLIDNISNAFTATLSKEELGYIMEIFSLSFEVLPLLINNTSPYIKDAMSDFNSSVFHIFENPPHCGLSKWASLQFVEKLIKSFLKTHNCPFPRDHDIKSLAQLAIRNGMGLVSGSSLDAVYCRAGVRYGEQVVTIKEAIEAHHEAIRIAHKIYIK